MGKIYLIHDRFGELRGTSTSKKEAKALVEQRVSVEKLTIQKIDSEEHPDEMLRALRTSSYNIMTMQGVGLYIFEYEEEDIKNAFYAAHVSIHDAFDDIVPFLKWIKFDEVEQPLMCAFESLANTVVGNFQEDVDSTVDDDFLNVDMIDYVAIGLIELQAHAVARREKYY